MGGDTTIDVGSFPGRKRPLLWVTVGSVTTHVASFRDQAALALFVKACGGEGARLVRRDTVIPKDDES